MAAPGTSALDEYRRLLEQGAPVVDPNDPSSQDLEFKYYDDLSSAKQAMDAEEALSFEPHSLDPNTLTSNPDINTFYSSAVAAQIVPERQFANVPQEPPKDVSMKRDQFSKAADIEEVPEKAAVLEANLVGFEPAIQSRLLSVYKETLDEGGSKNDAYRRFLLYRRDTLNGDSETGWPEFPGGAPNKEFWDRYVVDAGGFTDSPQTRVTAAKELYNMYRTKGIPKYTEAELGGTDAVSLTKQALHRLGMDGKGPLDPYDAYTAMNAFDRARDQAAGGGTRYSDPRKQNLDFDLMTSAVGGPLAPVTRGALGGVFGIGTVLASRGAQKALPEGTPDAVRTAIDFGLYSIGNKGTMTKRLLEGAQIGLAAGAGEAVATEAGAPGIIGAFAGPVLAPGTAAIARRQFQFMAEQASRGVTNPEKLQENINKLAINLTKDDLGATVAIGDNLGTVDSLVGKEHLGITLENGLQVTVRRDEVLYLPGTGKSATIASEAERIRKGLPLDENDVTGVVLTPEAIDSMPLGETYVHYTPAQNVSPIMREGFIPTPAGPDTLPGVYTLGKADTATNTEQFSRVFGGQESTAVFVQAPNGRIANTQDVESAISTIAKRPGDRSPETMARAAQKLQEDGFVGAQYREGTVFFDAQALKPKVAAEASRWDDFVSMAKGIMEGTARVTVFEPLQGNAWIQGLSKEANQLIAATATNANDYRMLATALRSGAKAKTLPNTSLGAAYLFAKSAIGMNPGLRRIVQPAVFAASAYHEADQVLIGTRLFTLQKAVKEAFTPAVLDAPEGRHFLNSYRGPPLTGSAGDYVVGTLAHVIDQPKLYNLTDTQSQVIDLWQVMLRQDAKVTEAAGVGFELIERNYVPYKRKDTDPTFAERILSPQTRGQGTGTVKPGFAKPRSNASLTDWAEFLASKAETVELDPFKLYLGRLQGSAKLRADQVLLRSIIKAHGVPIDFPKQEKALREAATKLKDQLKDRVATSIRQSVRNSANQAAFNKLDNLVAQTEKELGRIDQRLFDTTGMSSPTWNNLEGQLQALDREADAIALAAQKSNENLTLALQDHARTKDAIQQMRNQLKGLQGRMKNAKRATPPPGWTEIGIGKGMGRRYAVPDEIAREMNVALAPQAAGDVTARAKETLDFFRSMLLSVDGSFLTNQGYAVANTDPLLYMRKMGSIASVTATEEGFTMYMAQNLDAFTKYAQAGGTLYMNAIDVVKGAGVKSAIDRVPGVAQLNEFGYGRLLPVMKMMGWQTLNHMVDNIVQDKTLLQRVFAVTPVVGDKANLFLRKFAGVEGKSAQEIMEATADVMNNIGGGINYGKLMTQPSLASQMVFLTEGWMRANIGRIVTAAKVGDPAGVLARRWMFQNLAVASALSTGLSLMLSGRTPSYDPTDPAFLDIQVGPDSDLEGGSIPFLPGKTYIRAAIQGIAGVPWETTDSEIEQRVGALTRFGYGRTGQVLRLANDLATGKDYLGRPIDNKWNYIGRNMTPVAFQNATDNLSGWNTPGLMATGVGFLGLNWVPRNPYDARDAKVAETGITDPVTKERYSSYGQMTDSQRVAFDKTHPEFTEQVAKWQEERDSPFAALRANRESHREAVVALGKAFMGQPLSDAERALMGSEGANIEQIRGNTRLYRNMLGSLSDHYREEAARVGQSSEAFAPESTSQAIVAGYYTEVIDKSRLGGQLDYAVLDANERAYRRSVLAKYGEDGERVLDEELLFRTTDDPVAQAYHKDQTLWNPYFNYLDSFWKPENLTYAGMSEADAATATKFPNREQYQGWLTQAYVDQLAGQALPQNIYNLKSSASGDTIGKKWAVTPGKRLTEAQAKDIGEELVRIQMKKYTDLVSKASDAYLSQNTEALCAMSYWEIIEPSEATRPYLVTCDRGRVPGK